MRIRTILLASVLLGTVIGVAVQAPYQIALSTGQSMEEDTGSLIIMDTTVDDTAELDNGDVIMYYNRCGDLIRHRYHLGESEYIDNPAYIKGDANEYMDYGECYYGIFNSEDNNIDVVGREVRVLFSF